MAVPALTVGRYALRHEIAAGGMAVVHLGRLLGPAGFSRTVAIKRLHPHLARDPEFVAMFLDEARLAGRIRHPNVVSTLDVVATDAELFVVMEYVPGDSLARLLRAGRDLGEPVPLPIAASIMVNVLHGLHAAHEVRDDREQPLGLVHRDVSPQNVLVGTDGAAHLIDFGVAKAAGRAQVTREGQLKGKLAYMAPEHLLGQPIDRRADVFGAAVVFWEMLTGARLFDGDSEGEIYGKVLRADVPRPSKRIAGLGRRTDAIVLRGLARNPARRYDSARDMAIAVEKALPLAPPSQVGQWVERLVADTLAERRAQIASIERDGEDAGNATSIRLVREPDPAAGMATAPGRPRPTDVTEESLVVTRQAHAAPREAPATDTSLVSSELEPLQKPSRRAPALAAAGIVLALVAAVFVLRRGPIALPEAYTPPATSTRATAPSAATPSEPAANGPAAVTPAATAPAPVTPTAPPSATAIATTTTTAPNPRPRHTPAAACNPPYTIDASGYRKYKRECATL
jgi:eukaryotic-like serine/threonine-protein kinase